MKHIAPRPKPPKIVVAKNTSAPGCDLVRQWLREHNWATNPEFMACLQQPEHEAQTLVLLAHDDIGVVGGLFAETRFAWLRISIIAVEPENRSRGIGSALLAAAEREAIKRGCKQAYVDTMEYHAPRFYLSRGYQVAGEIPNWDSRGHRKFFFTKNLKASPAPQLPVTITYRMATEEDCPRLAELNHQLIRDEGHRNRMTLPELEERMRGWIAHEYRAVIFEDDTEIVAHALFREQPQEIYLRQFFVVAHRRRQGIGQRAIETLRKQVWPANKRLTVAALTSNTAAVHFWRSVGFQNYALSLEMMPKA
jgi:GNAT superfamily N-acetyltransferase